MPYFVTGATGFIGKRLVREAARAPRRDGLFPRARKSRPSVPTRCSSTGAWTSARRRSSRSSATWPSRARRRRGRSEEARGQGQALLPPRRGLRPQGATRSSSELANIDGTRNAVAFAKAIGAGCFHHVSSIAAAGLYEGVFREDMFEEAENLDHPYFRTKHDSERIVRKRMQGCRGASIAPAWSSATRKTGEMDKIDGPYYFFKLIQRHAPAAAAVDADDRHRGRPHQHRAGRLRRRRDGPHRAPEGPRRQVLPPDRSGAAPRRRRAQHLRQGGARAGHGAARQRRAVRLHPRRA